MFRQFRHFTTSLTLAFDFQGQSLNTLSLKLEGRLTGNARDVTWSFMIMAATLSGQGELVNKPDNDQSDFRCWCAVDILSFGSWSRLFMFCPVITYITEAYRG